MFKNKHCLLLNGLESICKRGSGLWGFRGWLVRECFVCTVGVGGFHILPHCHIWESHLCRADGSPSTPILMARGAARSGPGMAIPGHPGEGSGAGLRQPVCLSPSPAHLPPFSPSLPRWSWPASWLGSSNCLKGDCGTRGLGHSEWGKDLALLSWTAIPLMRHWLLHPSWLPFFF